MPLPLILGIGAAIAGAAGVGAGIKGAVDTKDAKDMMEGAELMNNFNLERFKKKSEKANQKMEELGKLEMDVASDFARFSDAFEKIKNRPDFSELKLNADIPKFNFDEIQTASVGASAFLGAAVGGGLGVVFGTVAATGVTSAVVAIGTASTTGIALSALKGAAATKAALAAIGGGAISAGGGGVALGTTILGATTLGVGLLVGGAIFAFTGATVKEKAKDAFNAMIENLKEIENCIGHLAEIQVAIIKLRRAIEKTHRIYNVKVSALTELVNRETDWNAYSGEERLLVENNILVVSVLNKMINTPLLKVTKTSEDGTPSETDMNDDVVYDTIESAYSAFDEKGIA